MTESPSFTALLDRLDVPSEGVLYVQASADWLQRAGFSVSQVLDALIARIGSAGTLVVPCYPFTGRHADYLAAAPVYDVRFTAAAIGLLPEVFRRMPGVVRSLDPDFCVAALGQAAAAIAGGWPLDTDPFGPDTSYQRMLDRRATLLGLGVSLNTTSFIHLVDSRAAAGYPAPVYEDELRPATVVDRDGRTQTVLRKAIRPPFQQLTNPAAVIDAMAPGADVFTTLEVGGARFFRWDLHRWCAWCLAHAADRARASRWPCWLARLEGGAEAAQVG